MFLPKYILRDEAGDGGDGGGGFDPAAFEAKLKAEFTTMLNGGIGRIEKQLKGLKAAGDPPPSDPPNDPPPDPKGESPEVLKLRKQLETLTGKVEQSEKSRLATESAAKEKERLSMIRTELAKQGLADHAVDDAFRYFRDEIKFAEDGSLVGGADESPLAEFVKSTVESRAHWLPPKQQAGAGAGPGNGRGRANVVTMDSIKPGMKPEDSAAARSAILQVLQGGGA